MLKFPILLLLAGIAIPAPAAKRVTVHELEELLAAAHDQRDGKLAQEISDLELTERMSTERLTNCEANLPGPRARQALLAIADLSMFLDPPAAEIPDTPAPDLAAQRRMLAQAVRYAEQSLSKLPNFFANRVTESYRDSVWFPRDQLGKTDMEPHPLVFAGRYSAKVSYRRGGESDQSRVAESGPVAQGLTTSGEFGPILGTALLDAAQGNVAWSRWGQGAGGLQAIFRFAVPASKSHYQVDYCCIWTVDGGMVRLHEAAGYHGEIAIDPSNGAILRLAFKADLRPTDPIVEADIMVEYGLVDIGGKIYICPVKSVAISMAPANSDISGSYYVTPSLQRTLNNVVFEQYHVFRADMRVLTEEK
jgi:hypothetical protein